MLACTSECENTRLIVDIHGTKFSISKGKKK